MTQDVTLSKGAMVMDLGALLNPRVEHGLQALAGLSGQGLPAVSAQWFEGAGDGATWRGSRVLARDIDVPLLIEGRDADHVQALLSTLAQVLDPRTGPARITLTRAGQSWWTDVVRVGGGTWKTGGSETDGETWVATLITLRSGDPFWTREDAESFEVRVTSAGRGLLPKLSRLRLTSSQAMGTRTVENAGDAPAYPRWVVTGPGANFTATGARGEVLRWEGTLLAGEQITLDAQAGTVVDGAGVNRYDQLAPAPRFWSIEPGTSRVSVTLDGATAASRITCAWQPRRQVSF